MTRDPSREQSRHPVAYTWSPECLMRELGPSYRGPLPARPKTAITDDLKGYLIRTVPISVSGVDTANAGNLYSTCSHNKKGFEERGEHVLAAAVTGLGRSLSHGMSRTREMTQ